jgi:hypothetical protein
MKAEIHHFRLYEKLHTPPPWQHLQVQGNNNAIFVLNAPMRDMERQC